MTDMTTMKVPVLVRDRLRKATAPGHTQGETIAAALDALEREQFWEAIASQVPDQEYLQESAAWLDADLTSALPRRVHR